MEVAWKVGLREKFYHVDGLEIKLDETWKLHGTMDFEMSSIEMVPIFFLILIFFFYQRSNVSTQIFLLLELFKVSTLVFFIEHTLQRAFLGVVCWYSETTVPCTGKWSGHSSRK